jgi:hypothetical protein
MNLTPAPVYPGAVPNMDLTQLEENADTLKLVYDRYQTYMKYPLVLQDIGKSGLIYGLGWGKMCWLERQARGTADRAERDRQRVGAGQVTTRRSTRGRRRAARHLRGDLRSLRRGTWTRCGG